MTLARPTVLALSLLFAGCSPIAGARAEAALATFGEGLCEAFLPLAVPGLGAADVLACKGAEALVLGALSAAGVGATPAGAPLTPGGSARPPTWGPAERYPLTRRGVLVALVPAGVDRTKAQRWIDASAGVKK